MSLESDNAKFRKALEAIAKLRYGVDLQDSEAEQIEYWSNIAIEYRYIARQALSKDPIVG